MFRGARPFIVGVMAAAIIPVVAPPASALTREQIRACESKDEVAPDQRIAGCMAVIEFKSTTKPKKTDAFINRGKAH
eukprot:COSAG03_NODE_26543_length_258_cov_1.207547_1_plen_76_part_01